MLFDNRLNRTFVPWSRFGTEETTNQQGWLGGIDKSDVPHVYHHLRKGCILQLHPITGQNQEHLMYAVNYGSYRLGILSSRMARQIQKLERQGITYRLTISGMAKEKYLPPTGIELELEWSPVTLSDVA